MDDRYMNLGQYENLFGCRGPLAANLPRYEFRQGQLDMAKGISNAIERNEHLIVEAGTGIGKSFAYLIPFIEWAVKNDRRVVIATYTKALQEQLAKKDIPFLEGSLGINFRSALCFGGENYLCRRRLFRSWQKGLFERKMEASQLQKIMEWAVDAKTGLRMELPFEPEDGVWLRVCRESDVCRGKRCKHRQDCFYAKARSEQARAQLLIANHQLFFANIASGMQLFPQFDSVVFDEAHNIEEVAASHFGFELTNTQLKYLLDEFHHPRHETGFFHRFHGLKKHAELLVMANAARQAGEVFFDSVFGLLNGKTTLCLRSPNCLENILSPTLEQMADAISDKIKLIQDEEDREELTSRVARLSKWGECLCEFIEQKREEHVYWIEAEQRHHGMKYRLSVSPVDVTPYLKKFVFDEISPIVLTSATLSVGGNFEFMRSRLGLNQVRELSILSPFDFENQALLYLPSDLPDPSNQNDEYIGAIASRIDKLVHITEGRSFVLFTSYQTLNRVHDCLAERLKDFRLLRQRDLPRWRLLEEFKKGERAVLFGTTTFWQGIDVPGSALECVIITKLPFAVPDHPLIEARIADLKRRGEDPFMGYQVPKAALLFKQGFGRLIRHTNDIGIVAVLDPRMKTRSYGRAFLESLPQCREINDIDSLAGAYKALKHNVV